MISPILNPILTRELRARWRGGRSMILVLCYAAFLSATAGLVYASSSISNDAGAISGQMARVGHDLFLTLSGLQIVAWMLIGPALTATSIAGERERGLLEGLQLTPLSPARICSGKLSASLLLVVLLMFAPLPVTSLCFLLGGVSPQEFCIALALQVATVLCGMCLGLWISCRSRRATGAMTSTFIVVVIWTVFSFLIFIAHESRSPWAYAAPGAGFSDMLQSIWLDFAWRTNPILVFLVESVGSTRTPVSWFNTYFSLDWPDWVLNVAFGLISSLFFWVFAARTLRKPFADVSEEVVEQPKRRWFERATNAAQTTNAIEYSIAPGEAKTSSKTSDSVWWQWNWLAAFRSPNPMLEREVRRRARFRRTTRRSRKTTKVVGVVALGLSVWALMRLAEDPLNRSSEAWAITTILAFLAVGFFAAVQGALLFTREHEAGTWEGIQLSLLSARQILWGKVVPPLVTSFVIAAVMWAPSILCVDGIFFHQNRYTKVTFPMFFGTILVACFTSWAVLSWGAFWSSQMRRVWPAVVWTIGSLLFLYVAFPILVFIIISSTRNYGNERLATEFFRFWHPVFALVEMYDTSTRGYSSYNSNFYRPTVWRCIFDFCSTMFVAGALSLWFAHNQLRRLISAKSSRELQKQVSEPTQNSAN